MFKSKNKVEKTAPKQIKPTKQLTTTQSNVPDLIYKSYADGCLVLACVNQVSNNELVVVLPGIRIFGHIKVNQISNEYTNYLENELNKDITSKNSLKSLSDMYSLGNLVRCKVLNYENKRLNLTMQPNQVNSNLRLVDLDENMIITGSIKSKEDHGYSVNLGISNLIGFINTNQDLIIGKCYTLKIVGKPSENNVIKLAVCENKEFSSVKYKSKFDSYLPGSRINCVVDKICRNGLKLSINNDITAYIPQMHLESSVGTSKKQLKTKYKNGDRVDATILYVNPYSKIAYLTQLKHLKGKNETNIDKSKLIVGDNVDCTVIDHSIKGLFVKIENQNCQKLIGFVLKKDLMDKEDMKLDKKESENGENGEEDDANDELEKDKFYWKRLTRENLEKLYPINSNLKARCVEFNLIEDLVILSARKSVMEMSYLSMDELSVGDIVKCKVVEQNKNNGGLIVRLSEYVNGFIPKIHTADIPLNEPLNKMPIGSVIKCRIIQLNKSERKLILTAKKTLIKSKLPEINAIDYDLELNSLVYGVVVAIKEYGLMVSFNNDVKALLPRSEIIQLNEFNKNDDLKKLFSVGQLLKCRLCEINVAKQLLKVSLNLNAVDEGKADKLKKKKEEKIIAKKNAQLSVEDGKTKFNLWQIIENVTITNVNMSKMYLKLKLSENSSDFAILSCSQLSDCDELNEQLFKTYKIGDKLSNVMIIREKQIENTKYRHYFLTLKKSLIEFYHRPNKIVDSICVNQTYMGWVCKKMKSGVLVEIPLSKNRVGFCSNKKIIDTNSIKLGTSVLVTVHKVVDHDKLFVATIDTVDSLQHIRNSDEINFNLAHLKSYLDSGVHLIETNSIKNLKNYPILTKLTVKVVSIDHNLNRLNCVYEHPETKQSIECYGYLNINENLDENKLVNQTIESIVIDYDLAEKKLCLSFDKKQITLLKRHMGDDGEHCCKSGQLIKAEILFFNSTYAIVALKQHAIGHFGYIPLFKYDRTQSKLADMQNKLAKLENNLHTKIMSGSYYSIGKLLKVRVKDVCVEKKRVLCVQEGKLKDQKMEVDEDTVETKQVVEKLDVHRKRKLSEKDENVDSIQIIRRAKKEKKSSDTIGESIDFPWEIKSFDQFYEVINENKENESEVNGDSSISDTQSRKKHKKNANKDGKIQENEEALFDGYNRDAQNADDYERLLVAHPNSSLLWIKYMVFYLQSAEIEKARDVAERALKTILYRDEAERCNIWVAYLNLENMYGTTETLDEVFSRATQNCDSLRIHQHLAEIYARSSKFEDARLVYNKMIRKFNKNPDVWIKYAIYEYKTSNSEQARKLLIRSLNSLDKKDHVDAVNKFAQLEFKYGDIERAKTMFDSLLFTYQNRTDLWSVYIDMLIKYDRKDEARNVFNRIIQLNLTAKRMKFIFKKYIDFEKAHGNEETLEHARNLATKYVENKQEAMKMALPKDNNYENNNHTNNNNDDEFKLTLEKHIK